MSEGRSHCGEAIEAPSFFCFYLQFILPPHTAIVYHYPARALEPSMSLTSRLSNWFSQDSSIGASLEAQRNDAYSESTFDIDGARQIKRPRTMERLAEEEVDLELKRPPYLQVRVEFDAQHASIFWLTRNTGNARWRRWRNYRRHSDALTRYCQDETARRSPFPTQVRLIIRLLR